MKKDFLGVVYIFFGIIIGFLLVDYSFNFFDVIHPIETNGLELTNIFFILFSLVFSGVMSFGVTLHGFYLIFNYGGDNDENNFKM